MMRNLLNSHWSTPRIFTCFAIVTLGASVAQADPIIYLASGPTASGGLYTWNYDATFTGSLVIGDNFTLYDLNGIQASSIATPANFTASVQAVGLLPSLVTVPDSNAFNVTYFYTGPASTLSTPLTLTGFGFQTTTNNETTGYAAFNTPLDEGVQSVTLPGFGTVTTQNAPYGSLTVTAVGPSVPAGNGKYLTTYQLADLSGYGYGPGSFFTIYDVTINGNPASISVPANWSCTFPLSGHSPPNILVADITGFANITCTYTGPAVAAGTPSSLGDFTFINSNDPLQNPVQFYSSDVLDLGALILPTGFPAPSNQIGSLITENQTGNIVVTPEPPYGLCSTLVLALTAFFKRKALAARA